MNKSKSYAMFISDPSQKGTIKCGIQFLNLLKILGITFSDMQKVHEILDIDPKIEQLKRLCSLLLSVTRALLVK